MCSATTHELPPARDGGRRLLWHLRRHLPTIRLVWADAGYAGKLVAWAAQVLTLAVQIVRKRPRAHHFEVLPRRWVVERTFSWLGKCCRLAVDYERRAVPARGRQRPTVRAGTAAREPGAGAGIARAGIAEAWRGSLQRGGLPRESPTREPAVRGAWRRGAWREPGAPWAVPTGTPGQAGRLGLP